MAYKRTGRPVGRPRKPCDGTANDYWRHMRHGEEPCQESRWAHGLAQRRYRRSRTIVKRYILRAPKRGKGFYVSNLPGQPGDVQRLRVKNEETPWT